VPITRLAERLRRRLAGALMLLAASGTAVAATPQQVGSRVRACGQIKNVNCDDAGAVRWLIDLDDSDVLLIQTDAVPDASTVRELALRHGFGRLCVAGRLVHSVTPFEPALLAVDALSDITPEGEPVADALGPNVARTCDPGVRMAPLVKAQRHYYTREARSVGVQGAVWVEAVVDIDGKVSRVRVLRSLDRRTGLDAEAVAAVKRWRFRPGTKDGQPVTTAVIIVLEFNLK
jgi:TonB family protein